MENKIYVVMGTTGEYSDRSEWPVIAYFDEEKAKRHVTLARQEAKRILHLAKRYNKLTIDFERIYIVRNGQTATINVEAILETIYQRTVNGENVELRDN